MAKLSAINKNNKRLKMSNKFYEKRKKLKKIIMNKKLPLQERFIANKNYQNCQEIPLKQELWVDVKLLEDHMVFTEN